MKQVSRNYAEISESRLNKKISAPGLLVHISMLEEFFHDEQCVVTAQLQ